MNITIYRPHAKDCTQQQDRPSVTAQPCCHRWCYTKRLVDANEIEIHKMKGHGPRPLIPLGPALTTRPEAFSLCSKGRTDLRLLRVEFVLPITLLLAGSSLRLGLDCAQSKVYRLAPQNLWGMGRCRLNIGP
jgi:hypothetical protein